MAAISSNQILNVKPFDGIGFSNWEFRVKLILEQAGVLEVLDTVPPANADELAKFKKCDVKARNIIVQCLSDTLLEMIKSKSTAKEIMEALSSTYQKKGISTQVQLQKKLRSLKFTEGTPINVFFTEFEQTVYELKGAGGKMEPSEIVSQLLSSMPETYQAVTTAIDIMFCQDESKVTLDFVKNKLLMEESRQVKAQAESSSNEAAFSGYKKKWNKKWNRKGNQTENRKSEFPFKCHGCGVVGHKKYECPKNQKKDGKANVAENTESENAISFLTAADNDSSLACIDQNFKEVKFIIDSGATNHLVNKTTGNFLKDKEVISHVISVAKRGETIEATTQGNLHLKLENGREISMKNVWMCDKLLHNLLSVRKLEEKGFQILFKNKEVLIMKNNEVVLKGQLMENLYVVTLSLSQSFNDTAYATTGDMLVHRRMGHSLQFPAPGVCDVCLQGKQARLPFKSILEERKAKRILEVISSDVCGPINPPTYDGKQYYVSFIDHFSHFAVCYLITKKSEVLDKFQEYVKFVEAKFDTKIERIRCDNGGEYSSAKFKNFCLKNGIKCQYTIARNPEQNGVAERYNRTIMEKARCLIFDSKLDKSLWGEAMRTAVFLTNRTPTSTLPKNMTPAEIWYKQKPNMTKIKLFGSIAYNLIPKEDRKTKLDSHSQKLIMVGYVDNGYRLWDEENKKIVLGRNVVFDETNEKKIPIEISSESNEEKEETQTEKERKENDKGKTEKMKQNLSGNIRKVDDTTTTRRSTRNKQLPKHLEDYEVDLDSEFEVNLMAALSAGSLISDLPQNFTEAVSHDEWKAAIQEELNSLQESQTWELVPPPEDTEIIDSKWVFREKVLDGKVSKRARLVARGFKQCSLDEDVYAPVARMVTIRVLLSLFIEYDLHVQQLDVSSAFLYGTLDTPVYMYQPEGLEKDSNLVCKLTKSLYGLKQAPKCWNSLFHRKLTDLGLKRSQKDSCLYFDNDTFLLVYVDDIILFSKSLEILECIKNKLSQDFKIKDFKNKSIIFLGLEINKIGNELYICQKELIRKVLRKFNMDDCKLSDLPMQPKLQLSVKSEAVNDKLPYRELIGCLMYIMLGSRPDLSFCVTYFSQFQNGYTDEHWNHLKNVLRYLKQTENFGLRFTTSSDSNVHLVSYV